MKIAMLIKNFVMTGGAERYAVELSTRLARRGHDIHVFAQRWDSGLVSGITLHPIPRLHRPRFLNSLYYALAVRRQVMRERFEIVHSHQRTIHHHVVSMHLLCYSVFRPGASPAARRLSAITSLFSPRHLVYRWLESRQFGCRVLTHVVAVSGATKQDILTHYPLDPATVRVIYPGVDTTGISPDVVQSSRRDIRKQYDLSDDDLVLVFVGSEFKRKGLQYALEALALLHRDDRLPVTPRLLVVGRGNPGEYQRLAAQRGIGRLVHFVGLRREVWPYYAAADICILPTLGDTFSLAVLEAMACGLPVVVSRQAGVAELLQHGYNAMLLDDPRDPRHIAEQLRALCDGQRRSEMGRSARETAASLTWDRMTDDMVKLYHESLGQRGSV
jgi:UDP-glucose:(heptosyl)LPS alpha-1,3-glucosyltransferase